MTEKSRHLEVDFRNADVFDIARRNFPQVAARSVKRTLDQVRTQAIRQITGTYNISAGDVRPFISGDSRMTQGSTPIARLIIRGKRFTLGRFNPRQTKTGVRVRIRKGSPAVVKGAFIAATKQNPGLPLVWRRIPGRFNIKTRRQLIEPLRTASLPQMVGRVSNLRDLNRFFQSKLIEVARHELKYFLFKKTG